MQVSHSKKWASEPALDEQGAPLRTKTGKIVLRKSYSTLQDKFHDHMFAAGFTDVERGERGSTEEHLTTVQFKVMKEQESLNGIIARQQNAVQAAELAETHRQEAEQQAEAAQKKLDALTKNAKDTETFIQKLGPADVLLPDAGMLETDKGYRTNKALPVVKKLIHKLKTVYQLLLSEREISGKLTRDVAFWKQKAEVSNMALSKAAKIDKLTKVLGAEEIDRLLMQRPSPERIHHHIYDHDR